MAEQTFDPFDSPELKDPLNENWAAKREVADATRQLIENLVACTTNVDDLKQVAAAVAKQADVLAQAPQIHGRIAFEEAEGYGCRGSLGYELNPLDGKCNPIAAPIYIWFEGDRAYGRVTMGWQYEGPPVSVHGGFVAALFDQFLGAGQKLSGQPGFTGTLTVRYLKPTPIDTELRLEGWVERVEGRKNFLVGEMWAGDVKTATCEGVFISITREVFEQLHAKKR